MTEPTLVQPPHSIEAEQSVLGALLLDNEALDRIPFLMAEHFYRHDHRLIFEAVKGLIDRGRAADLVLTTEHMESLGTIGKTGGAAYIGALAQNTPSAYNIARYAEVVRDKAILRALIASAQQVMDKALAGRVEPRELAEEAEVAFLQVLDVGQQSDFVHIGQAATEYIEWSDNHPNGIPLGLTDLDGLTGGMLPGNLIVVAARPHMGKTALAIQVAENVCTEKPGLMFSLEAQRREIAGRMVEWHKHRLGRDAAVDQVFKLSFYVDDSAGISPAYIRSKIRRFRRQHGCAIAVVDYLQLVRGKGDSREQEVSFVSRELKAIAKEFQIPLIALAQLNRKVEERADKRPHMADLRESGAIEQDADLIMLLYRPDFYDTKFEGSLADAEVIVSKNRNNGRTGSVKVTFSRDLGRFGDHLPDMYRTGAA